MDSSGNNIQLISTQAGDYFSTSINKISGHLQIVYNTKPDNFLYAKDMETGEIRELLSANCYVIDCLPLINGYIVGIFNVKGAYCFRIIREDGVPIYDIPITGNYDDFCYDFDGQRAVYKSDSMIEVVDF